MDQVEEVKQKTDIVSVVSGYVELKKQVDTIKVFAHFMLKKHLLLW